MENKPSCDHLSMHLLEGGYVFALFYDFENWVGRFWAQCIHVMCSKLCKTNKTSHKSLVQNESSPLDGALTHRINHTAELNTNSDHAFI